ncbi:hypothetical protein SLEP1_g11450 [Rubroshorea leprosula]|uniref:EGF-like domain-containing protein n=1 Tax=Rubroshorea leprosula TaxID=152421 RepID=A0AAV5IH81_9ROSI|nr:hypothetical protein SLEP1_g11450 [Rubroshorea leprosula]
MGIHERFWLVILIAAPLAAIVAEPAPILVVKIDTFDPPLAFLANSTINVTNIDPEGKLHITQFIAHDCYDKSGASTDRDNPWLHVDLCGYTISDTDNKFVAVGCGTIAYVEAVQGIQGNKSYIEGCITKCDSIDYVTNYTCSGIGCCQTSIPKGTNYINVTVTGGKNHTRVWKFIPCGCGFIMEEGQFNFSSNYLLELQYVSKLPLVLDWSIWDVNHTCGNKANACQGNSYCIPVDDYGYQCNCLKGFKGNPYPPSGCQDINESLDPNNNDCKDMICSNTVGSCTCSCLKGYHRVEINGEQGCTANQQHDWNLILVPVGKKLIKLKQKFFMQNGGLMLQQQLSNHEGSAETTKIFSAEELEKATNNFDESGILVQGGYETVYKGPLKDGRIVAIKKSTLLIKVRMSNSFGVVLLKLLIGEKVLSFDRAEEERNLSMYFLSTKKDNCSRKILDGCVVNEANIEQLNELANLARRCLSVKGKERHTMKEVAMKLQELRSMTKHPWVNDALNAEEAKYLLGETFDKFHYHEYFDASAIFACLLCLFSPLQPDINQPFPTPPPEKLKILQICCLLPPLPPVAAGCELRFSCGPVEALQFFRQLFPIPASSSLVC